MTITITLARSLLADNLLITFICLEKFQWDHQNVDFWAGIRLLEQRISNFYKPRIPSFSWYAVALWRTPYTPETNQLTVHVWTYNKSTKLVQYRNYIES